MKDNFEIAPFPYQECKFDKRKDLKETDQVGFLDLNKVYATGVVEGAVSFDENFFNGVLEPAAILHRPKDNFERMRQADYVRSAVSAANSKNEQSVNSD